MKDIHDVITHAKFGDDGLRGSGVVVGQISAFPIDFAGRPYNTLILPCERVKLDHAFWVHLNKGQMFKSFTDGGIHDSHKTLFGGKMSE